MSDFKNNLTSLVRTPLHEQAYATLRESLMSGKFAPGLKLKVREISSALGISPIPTRVAMGKLVSEQALATLANGTIIVPYMTIKKFEELVSTRFLLEGEAVELATKRATPKEQAKLEKTLNELEAAAKKRSLEKYLEKNREFKFLVFSLSKNEILTNIIEGLWLQLGPSMRNYAFDVETQLKTDRHWQGLHAIKKGNASKAKTAFQKDIIEGASFLKNFIEFTPDTEVPKMRQNKELV